MDKIKDLALVIYGNAEDDEMSYLGYQIWKLANEEMKHRNKINKEILETDAELDKAIILLSVLLDKTPEEIDIMLSTHYE